MKAEEIKLAFSNNQTEKTKVKIEFGVAQDIVKEFDIIVSKDKNIGATLLSSLNDAYSKYNAIYSDYLTNLKKAQGLKIDIEKLGVKTPQELENVIKANMTTSGDVSANMKNIKKLVTTV